jgi:hypothetical protein
MALVLYFAALLAWLKRPSSWMAALIGSLIALAILVKPVAQVLLFSTLPLMAYQLWRLSCLKRFWLQAVVLLVVTGALLAPWYIRNKVIFGEYFLTRFTGRTLWITCHVRERWQFPVEFSNGPKTRAMFDELAAKGINEQSATWEVSNTLREIGYSDPQTDKIMEGVMFESILAHPGQYAAGRLPRFIWFWVTPKAWVGEDGWGWFYSTRGLPTGWPSPPDSGRRFIPPGQVTWSLPFLAAVNDSVLKIVWHPNYYVAALAALAAAVGCVFMIRNPAYRDAGLAVASIVLAISLVTSFFTWPEYRFRMPLEPFMIVAVTPALNSICHRLFGGSPTP